MKQNKEEQVQYQKNQEAVDGADQQEKSIDKASDKDKRLSAFELNIFQQIGIPITEKEVLTEDDLREMTAGAAS